MSSPESVIQGVKCKLGVLEKIPGDKTKTGWNLIARLVLCLCAAFIGLRQRGD